MFTCHEHIVELFTGAQVEIRYLSDFVPSQRVAEATPLPPPIVEIRAPQPDKHQELPEEPEEVEEPAESVAVLDEDYGLAEPVDEYEEEDYELGDAAHVLQSSPLEFFLRLPNSRKTLPRPWPSTGFRTTRSSSKSKRSRSRKWLPRRNRCDGIECSVSPGNRRNAGGTPTAVMRRPESRRRACRRRTCLRLNCPHNYSCSWP